MCPIPYRVSGIITEATTIRRQLLSSAACVRLRLQHGLEVFR